MTSQRHSVDRVPRHTLEVDRADANATDAKTLRRDIVAEAVQPPDLNRTAAAALLRIVMKAVDRTKVVREGDDRSVQS